MLEFHKMHGLGNDFVVIDQRGGGVPFKTPQVRAISDRKRGVGCDLIVLIQPPKNPQAAVYMDLYNADGSKPEGCGNATRCVAHLLMSESGTDHVVLESLGGLLHCRMVGDLTVEVDMGAPKSIGEAELSFGQAVVVNVGNPHCIFFVADAEAAPLETVGPAVECYEFFPNRTNVEFVQVLAPDKLRMRVWERGCGVTEACGTGACATIVAAVTRGLSDRSAEIVLDGGSLFLEWREADHHILMTGPVAYVFDGTMRNPL